MKSKTFKAIIPTLFIITSSTGRAATIKMPSRFPTTLPSVKSMDEIFQENLQLEEKFRSLIEAKNADNQKAVGEASRFFALALGAWNPSMNPNDIERITRDQIERHGVLKGLIEPALTMMDISYAAGRPEFGNMLNPMLGKIAPEFAKNLHDKYGLPMDYKGRSFDDVSKLSDQSIASRMQTALGAAFYEGNDRRQKFDINSDVMAQAIVGKDSYFAYASRDSIPNQMHSDDGIERGPRNRQGPGSTSTPRSFNDNLDSPRTYRGSGSSGSNSTPHSNPESNDRPKGILSKLDLVSMGKTACEAQCANDIFFGAATGAFAPIGLYGKIAAAVVGISVGIWHCSQSNECNPDPQSVPLFC